MYICCLPSAFEYLFFWSGYQQLLFGIRSISIFFVVSYSVTQRMQIEKLFQQYFISILETLSQQFIFYFAFLAPCFLCSGNSENAWVLRKLDLYIYSSFFHSLTRKLRLIWRMWLFMFNVFNQTHICSSSKSIHTYYFLVR